MEMAPRSNLLKIGFFGGSFDPIHFGHLKMAKDLAISQGLFKVWFSPANINPHKLTRLPASIDHRMKMISLAIQDEPLFSLLDIEAKRNGPSYTIDTVKDLLKQESASPNSRQIFLMMSDEALAGFFNWKDPEEIVKLVPLLIGSRNTSSKTPPPLSGSPAIIQAIEKGWSPTHPFKISSTEIREKLLRGESCEEFVPKKVLDYIYENNLYLKT